VTVSGRPSSQACVSSASNCSKPRWAIEDSHSRRVGEGETGGALFGDQAKRRLQQRLFQIAVVIAALATALVLAPAHVKGFYMSRPQRSLGLSVRISRVQEG
jgi:hypothetical protein